MASYIDLLGKSFWLPDPDSVSALAGDFAGIRNNIADAQSQLQALRSPGAWAEWTGQAADAFLRCLGQLPGQLSQAEESYATVTAALSGYASGLDPVVSSVRSLVPEAEEAEAVLRSATAALDHARSTGDHASVLYWEPRQRAATETVDGLTSRLGYLLGELDGLASHCVQQIGTAQHQGIQNDAITDFDRYVLMDGGTAAHDAHEAWDITGGVLDATFVKPFSSLPGDLENLWNEHDFQALGKVLDDVTGIIGVIGLAALVVAAVLPGPDAVAVPALVAYLGVSVEDAAAAGAVAGAVAGGAATAGVVAGGAAFDVNSLAYATDESGTSVSQPGYDAVGLAVGELGEEVAPDGLGAILYGASTAIATDIAQNGLPQSTSIPAVPPGGPDITDGMETISGGLQGLQAVAPDGGALQSGAVGGLLQPAGGIPASPAVLTVQSVSIAAAGQSEADGMGT
jgi:hypothetical protein